MKYVSIDIETTGLDPKIHKILSIGAIIEDTENPQPLEMCPKFYGVIIQRNFSISPRAAVINAELIGTISSYIDSNKVERTALENKLGCKFYEEDEIVVAFYNFISHQISKDLELDSPVKFNAAGKNFATFDNLFLEQLPKWKQYMRVRQRVLDPAILYVNWHGDDALPSLTDCKIRAEISGDVTHDALLDAWDVVQVLRKFY